MDPIDRQENITKKYEYVFFIFSLFRVPHNKINLGSFGSPNRSNPNLETPKAKVLLGELGCAAAQTRKPGVITR